MFHQLSQEEIVTIVDLMIAKVDDRLKDRDMGLGLLPAAKTLLAERGYDPVLGARPLRRTIQREIEDNLSEKILFGELKAGQIVIVDVEGTGPEAQLTFKGVPRPGEMPDAPPAETGSKAAAGGRRARPTASNTIGPGVGPAGTGCTGGWAGPRIKNARDRSLASRICVRRSPNLPSTWLCATG